MRTFFLWTVVTLLWAGQLWATELVYTPINPSFGGNPLNGTFLLNVANAQNRFREEVPIPSTTNPMQNFQDTLTRSLLSMLAGKIADASFGNGTIASDIPYEFGGYSILVHDQGNSMLVSITDPFGSQTSMTIGRFNVPSTTGSASEIP